MEYKVVERVVKKLEENIEEFNNTEDSFKKLFIFGQFNESMPTILGSRQDKIITVGKARVVLEKKGVFTEDYSNEIKKMAEMRNQIMHQFFKVDKNLRLFNRYDKEGVLKEYMGRMIESYSDWLVEESSKELSVI